MREKQRPVGGRHCGFRVFHLGQDCRNDLNGIVVVDLSGSSQSSSGIAGLIAKAVVTAINTAVADYVPHAKRANYIALSTIPAGKYHQMYGEDMDVRFIDQG